MCDAIFAFGQRGSHFLQCPSKRDHTRLPRKLQQLLSSNQIALVYHVTLGYQDSFLITYRDKEGSNWIACQGLPTELNDFLYATNENGAYLRSIPNIRVSLGPYNTTFFASDGISYLWMNLPPLLLSALQARIKNGAWIDKPRVVALGAYTDFVLITEKNAAVWDLPNYRILANMLSFSRTQEHGIEEVKALSMHAYRYHGFVAQSRNGTLLYENLPAWSLIGLAGMGEAILRDTREKESRARARELQRRPSHISRQWSSKKKEFESNVERKAKAKGITLSLSLSIGSAGIKFGRG